MKRTITLAAAAGLAVAAVATMGTVLAHEPATNLLLVERVGGIARAMGRPVATCAQARRRIGLGDPPRA